jgi:Cu(I)/Ag(I) efflux system membrane fusion protein
MQAPGDREIMMNTTEAHAETSRAKWGWAMAMAVVALLAIAGGYWLGARGASAPAGHEDGHEEAAHGEATVWTCSMHPQIRQPNPGLCPICAMDLIPASDGGGGEGAGPREFRTTPEAMAMMRIQTVPVERRFVESQVRMVGEVLYDETRLAYITAWVPGRIERMFADFTGTLVRKGDHMVELYSPELLVAKDELRRAKKALGQISATAPSVLRETGQSTLEAVRSRLRRWGMTDAQIAQAEEGAPDSDRITIYAPIGGTVIARNGQEGMYVETGERIYTIADLDKVWVTLEAYESDLVWLHFGQTVEFTTEAYPGQVFEGTIAFIDPTLNTRTRTVSVRVNVPNEKGLLKPGMFVRAVVRAQVATAGRVMNADLAGKWISPMHPEIVKDGPGACDICGMALVPAEDLGYVAADAGADAMPLVIPVSAPLVTGKRAVVYVVVPGAEQPTFEGREIVLGPRAGDHYIVESGLQEGERVVTEGNFKIDSALQISAKPSMMSIPGGALLDGEADVELQTALRVVFEAYIPMQEALAKDDAAAAREALTGLAEAVGSLPSGEAKQRLTAAVGALKAETELADLRTGFEPLSDELIEQIVRAGLSEGGAVYQIHCPMAFDFKGSDWLQRDEEIRNPYFGSEMFSCGEVERTLVEAHEGNPGTQPAGQIPEHQHGGGAGHE